MSDTMRAVTLHDFGNADALKLETVPKPVPRDGEVLVRIRAAGINPIDFKTRDGVGINRRWDGEFPFPVILGWDISGEVVESRSPDYTPGDEIYTMARFPLIGGAYAEFATVPAEQIAPKPASISHAEAAAVPLAALTSWQAMFDTAGLQAGQRVLVHAAAGGVGHLAVQIAKAKGAWVAGTASARNEDFVRGLGVDQFVDYGAGDFTGAVDPVDMVFHTIDAEFRPKSWQVVKPGGWLVSITGPVTPDEAKSHNGKGTMILVTPNAAQLRDIGQLIDDGKVKITLDGVYPLDKTADAHRHVEGGHTRGKVVIDIDG